jgi:hypothetical protein
VATPPSAPLVPLEPGERSWLLERAAPPRPLVVTVLLGVLLGPAVVLTALAAPIAGWLLRSWVVAVALLAGAALTAGLGWLIAVLARAALAARAVDAQLTTARAITARGEKVEQLRWSDVTAVAALRAPGVEVVGDVTWLDVAALAVELALDGAAERHAATTEAYWRDATGLVLRGRDGRVLTVPTLSAPKAGLEVVRALAGKRAPGVAPRD